MIEGVSLIFSGVITGIYNPGLFIGDGKVEIGISNIGLQTLIGALRSTFIEAEM